MNKLIKGFLVIFVYYIVLYINYFIENNNIHNVTVTLLWISTVLILLAGIGSLYDKDKFKPRDNSIIKVIMRILISFIPLIMVYFGDIAMGIIYGISLLMMSMKLDKKGEK